MKTKFKLLVTFAIIFVAVTAISCSNSNDKAREVTHDQDQHHDHKMATYTCSMHPEVINNEPGDCPKCGMELIEKITDELKGQSNAEDIKKGKFKVEGSCDMCEIRIESAITDLDGVFIAIWDIKTKKVEVSFVESKANIHDIQLAVAMAGYDTDLHKASNDAYNMLPDCCRYVRKL